MGVLDKIFGSSQPVQQPAQQQQAQQPATQQPAQQPAQPGNLPPQPTVPADPNNPTAPIPKPDVTATDDPLAQYGSLWENVPSASNNNEQPKSVFDLNQEQVKNVIAKNDFSKLITPDQLQAIGQGGEAAQQAFAQAIGNVAQQVMLQSIMVNSRLAGQGVNQAIKGAEGRIPEAIRNYTTRDSARTANPLLSNPAVKPVADAVQSQLLAKYPNATSAEITDMTVNYIKAMGQQFAPKQEEQAPTSEAGTDWAKFLDMGI